MVGTYFKQQNFIHEFISFKIFFTSRNTCLIASETVTNLFLIQSFKVRREPEINDNDIPQAYNLNEY